MSKLDLNLVRVFVAIYDTRSVTQAAERLALSQPTLSHSLARLRDAYSDRLFLRGSNGLAPTPLAEHLFSKFNDALAAIDSTLEQRNHFDPKTSNRRFQLAMTDIGALYFAPPLLQHFQESAPNIEIEITPISKGTPEELIAGRLDLAIGNLPSLVSSTQCATLFTEEYVCLMSKKHPTIGDSMTLKEFIAGRHVMVASQFSGHRLIDEALSNKGVARKIVAIVPHFTVLPTLLAQSDLLVILPSRVASLYVSQGGLKALKLPVKINSFEVRAHWNRGRSSSPAHQWLIKEIIETLGKL